MEPIGVAAATPKKGSPIKVMPIIATSQPAFEALLVDIPHQLSTYGHKLYIHINPTVEEVIALQKNGWKLDAALPSAYRPDVVTQQWSIDLNSDTMRSLRVKNSFFEAICDGSKTLEVRVDYKTIKLIMPGERVKLTTYSNKKEIKICDVRKYRSFSKMFEAEEYKKIMPWAKSEVEVLSLLREFYPEAKEKLGVVVLDFCPLK